ncbi:MAG: hypothetical protein K2R93_01685 [Gemmatimonadaceae bacterium]|nr:hypothetical protein [Gemmatimonadaceae bacterium]
MQTWHATLGRVGHVASAVLVFVSVAAAQPVSLATARISARRVCGTPPAGDSALLAVHLQLRALMTQTAEAFRAPGVRAEVLRYERERAYDRGPTLVRHFALTREARMAAPPFEAWPADSLARYGYVRDEANGTAFHAPDLATMASDAFVATHCYAVRRALTRDGVRWTVDITPVTPPAPQRAEVAATFFATGDPLRPDSLRFWYDGLPAFIARDAATGALRFAVGHDGLPLIRDWSLTMPILGAPGTKSADGLARTTYTRERVAVLGLKDVGGVTMRVTRGAGRTGDDSTVYAQSLASTRIALRASTDVLAAMAGATVTVTGANVRAALSARGDVDLGVLLPGRYQLAIAVPKARDTTPWTLAIDVPERVAEALAIVLRDESLVDHLCGPQVRRDGLAAIAGTAEDSAGRVVATPVEARWIASARIPPGTRGSRLMAMRETVRDTSDAAGRFVLCGVPRTTLTVRADSTSHMGAQLVELRERTPVRAVTLRVAPIRR